ncbi:serine hydrolase domain-containing protein [Flavobacterium sp. '19STA2R22 D10 B1']|uniref:serine hydrolase domain-containing protein n=1 Tax=Flavobacterium aerium TaxID=3037261 RepID=UPI00278BE3A9|nr:serine hydrolase domain-containing protein [Flavobacterium sp. '19STA2R22 D10 B1']
MTLNTQTIKIVISVLLISSGLFSCKSGSEHDRIDTVMKKFNKEGGFNGAVLVAEKGKIIYDTAIGYADVRTHSLLDKNSTFYLASLSKQFTAMGIMLLKKQKKIAYDDAIVKYFPQLPSYAKRITIRNLLNHTSGLKDYLEDEVQIIHGFSNTEVLNWLMNQKKLDFNPGEKYEYSNTGYVLLSLIIEKVSEKPFAVFMDQTIFKPLQMTHTKVIDTPTLDNDNRAIGFTKKGELDDYAIRTTGDGGIFSTAEDMFLWDQALYENKLIEEKRLQEAFTKPKLNNGKLSEYGFGWLIVDDNENKVVFHTGELNGYQTVIWRDLKREITIIMLTNMGTSFEMWPATNSILKILKAKHYVED